ncbi:hypothetical protein PP614_16610 [Mycobacteroides abscessus]|uniref:VG15 protein n=1 Tax=Mycobacteroides abscessus TaxID=36809 RepID=UPI00078E6C49|nr:hypothetical protein [Mycobacteroides abscessus]QSM04159.1 MuF-like minor capsid protein [Mycobacterium phage prophiGD51-2]AMU55749.1 hypothetical protein A3O02_11655 [Mycobacteroides abscessus]MBE5436495.1 hypothetical protein [Mycobacteroides abscessus]MDM1901654.1 hypothetical protein [Mycobacteroides abscessus]MDM1962695.1 hypothetical protein [Mycobacteroides abscessus]
MVSGLPEFQGLLSELSNRLGGEVANLVPRLDRLDDGERRRFITSAYPQIATPYLAAAGDLTAAFYDAQPSLTRGFTAQPAALAPVEQLAASGRWGIAQRDPIIALQGSATRSVFDSSRSTVLHNVTRETGAQWARYASANACGFCRMLATRSIGSGSLYSSERAATRVVGRGKDMSPMERRIRAAGGERIGGRFIAAGRSPRGNQKIGDRYHDHCRCTAVAIRPGDTYEPPDYVYQWERDYVEATRALGRSGEPLTATNVVRHMETTAAERTAKVQAARTAQAADEAFAQQVRNEHWQATLDWLDAEDAQIARNRYFQQIDDAAEAERRQRILSWLDAEDEHRAAVAYWHRVDDELRAVPAVEHGAAQTAVSADVSATVAESELDRAVAKLEAALASGADDATILRLSEAAEAIERKVSAEDAATALRTRRREQAAARREAADRDKWDRIIALIEDEGYDPAEAESKVTGVDIVKIWKRDFMAQARRDGHYGDSFEELLGSVHKQRVAELYLEAENATRGALFKRSSIKADGTFPFDPILFWSMPAERVRKHASPELAEWFDQNGRLTRTMMRNAILSGRGWKEHGGDREDFLQ